MKWRRFRCYLWTVTIKVPLKLKGEFIRRAMLYETEYQVVKIQQENKFNVTEMKNAMLDRQMYQTKLDLENQNECIRKKSQANSYCRKNEKPTFGGSGMLQMTRRSPSKESRSDGGWLDCKRQTKKFIGVAIMKNLEVNNLSIEMIYEKILWHPLIRSMQLTPSSGERVGC